MRHTLLYFFTTTTWWGKILGAFFGYLIGRAPGAIIGILIGNIFDKGVAEHLSRPYLAFHLEKNTELKAFFVQTIFSVLGFIAKSDGRVSKAEITFATALMDDLQLPIPARAKAKTDFEKGKAAQFNPDDMLSELFKLTQDSRGLLNTFVNIQYAAALCEPLSPLKLDAINHVFKQLGLAPLEHQFRFYQDFAETVFSQRQSGEYQHSQQHQTPHARDASLSQAYTLLSVTPASTQKQVKHAYRILISQHHPDRLIAKGASESEIKTANEKTQCITKAYEKICKAKGW